MRGARTAGVLLAAALLVSTAACGDAPATDSPVAPVAGLAVLAGEPDRMRLSIHDAAGEPQEASLPAPDTSWITGSATGSLVALRERSLDLTQSPAASDPAWERFPSRAEDLPADPLAFATWSPDGGRVVVTAATFDATPSMTLLVAAPGGETSRLIPVPHVPAIAPPAWIDDRRVLVQTEAGLLVVDVDSGELAAGPPLEVGLGRPLATAPAAGLVAIGAAEAGAVDILDLGAWLAGSADSLIGRVMGTGEIGTMAWDAAGDRLAVIWQQLDAPGSVSVYGRSAEWGELVRFELPGESAAAAVTWLN